MKRYTVGFIFNTDLTKVLLVHKTAPAWQVGLINGVGGKIEEGEKSIDCIVREVKEETNLSIHKRNWLSVGILDGGATVEVYGAIYKGETFKPYVFEKEKIEWFSVNKLPSNLITNLTWLIPLTIEKIKFRKVRRIKVKYTEF